MSQGLHAHGVHGRVGHTLTSLRGLVGVRADGPPHFVSRDTMTICGRCGTEHDERRGNTWCPHCRRDYVLQRRYGINVDDYDVMFEKQEGRCAICRTTKPGGKKTNVHLHVDHDKVSGQVRGLLCRNCNHRLLGAANHDAVVLERAAAYLRGETR